MEPHRPIEPDLFDKTESPIQKTSKSGQSQRNWYYDFLIENKFNKTKVEDLTELPGKEFLAGLNKEQETLAAL